MNSKDKTNLTADNFTKEFGSKLDSIDLPAPFSGKYHIIDCIKETPKRNVYILADDDGNKYVMKTGSEKLADALRQEQDIYNRLEVYPELPIPKLVDFAEDKDCCYLVTTYIEGLNLVKYQEKYAPLSENEVISLAVKMCNIIKVLHGQTPPIIHRDIKPENFILNRETGILYLVDLDTGRDFAPQKERDTSFVGTFSQAAPEQFGFSQSDARTDIYGLGKTMLYLLTGDSDTDNLEDIGISPDFEKIIRKSTEFDPKKRYESIEQILKDLRLVYEKSGRAFTPKMTIFCSVLSLLLGLFAGYVIGRSNTSPAGIDVVENTAEPIYAFPYSEEYEFTPENYTHYVDAIISDCYNYDKDSLAKHCEELAIALQDDKELNRVKVGDYAKLDDPNDPEFWNSITGINSIRAYLEYDDGRIYREIGNYDAYKDDLMRMFSLIISDTESNGWLSNYAQGKPTMNNDMTPYMIIVDCVRSYCDAFQLTDSETTS